MGQAKQPIQASTCPGARDLELARPLSLRIARVDGAAAMRRYAERAGDSENGAALIFALNGLSGAAGLRAGAALKVPEFVAP